MTYSKPTDSRSMRLKPGQQLVECLLLRINNLLICVFPQHGKSLTSSQSSSLCGMGMRWITMWHSRVDVDFMFNLVAFQILSTFFADVVRE